MEAIQNFGIQPTLLLAQIVNFLIILFLLRKFFFGPIVKMLEDRKKRIEESLKNADQIEARLQKTNEQIAKIIENAQKEAQRTIQEAKNKAQEIINQTTEEARNAFDTTVLAAHAEIKNQKEEMLREIQVETMTIVASVVKKVLGRSMSSREKQEMTKEAVREISKQI